MKPFKSLSGVRSLLLLLLLASCGEHTELEEPGVTNGKTVEVTKEIHIKVLPIQSIVGASTRSGSSKPEKGEAIGVTYTNDTATRAQTGSTNMTSQESAINNAYIVQFNGNVPDATIASVSANIASKLNDGSSITHTFNMNPDASNRIYVLANVASVPSLGTTLSDFEKPISYTSGPLPSTGLPMYAMQDIGLGGVYDVFQLKNVLAKLTFTCATPGATLKLKGVPSAYSLSKVQPGDNAVRPAGITYDVITQGVTLTSGAACYVPENLSGRNAELTSVLNRCIISAPDKSTMFVEISANSTTYNIYLGDGRVSDFNFVGGYSYNINATIYGTNEQDLRVGRMVDLNSSGETANCYIVDANHTRYYFNATVMGNGATTEAHTAIDQNYDANFPAITPSKLSPVRAEVLWESVNTDIAPTAGTIVSRDIKIIIGCVLFESGSTAGNAVIAAKDASDDIIWSWHIWRTVNTPVGVTLASIGDRSFTAPTLKMMDRNLGALRATPISSSTPAQDYGLYYQWGRKDPFQTQVDPATTSVGKITPATAVKQPTTFYVIEYGDWTNRNDNLWGCPLTSLNGITINSSVYNSNEGSKSIYDPCPIGWKVMPGYAFANATKDNSPWSNGYSGRNFAAITTIEGTPFYLPTPGYRDQQSGRLMYQQNQALFWSSSPPTSGSMSTSSSLSYTSNYLTPNLRSDRSTGLSVRCVQ